ncbi:MAG: metallopeptidase TldD-related protein [Candidatus Odinarchaeia archaeon]
MHYLDDLVDYAVDLLSLGEVRLAECRGERYVTFSINISEEGVKKVKYGVEEGIGIRVLINNLWRFTSIENPTRRSIKHEVSRILRTSKSYEGNREILLADVKPSVDKVKVRSKRSILNTNIEDIGKTYIELFKTVKSQQKSSLKMLKAFNIYFKTGYMERIYANTEGSKIYFEYPECSLHFSIYMSSGGKSARALESFGGVFGLEEYGENFDWKPFEIADKTISRGLNILRGRKSPEGHFKTILDPSMTGTLIHEAFGHLCEADLALGGGVITPNMLGKKIANEKVTIIDDPIVKNGGWVPYDSEGVKGNRIKLVENGVLKSFMVNREYAAKLNLRPTGNARASDYSVPPIIRMRNTYLQPGDWNFEEMLENVREGIYIEKFLGGQTSLLGSFQFAGQIGWLIEKGEITEPLSEISISGLTLEVLKSLECIGKNLEIDTGVCGKGQEVTVGDGGPHIEVSNLYVGSAARIKKS